MKIPVPFFLFTLALLFSACARQPYAFSGPGNPIGSYHAAPEATLPSVTPETTAPEPTITASATPVLNTVVSSPPAPTSFAPAAAPINSISGKPAPDAISKTDTRLPCKPGKLAKIKTRSKTLAAILAAPPLGMLGLHRLYLGYYLIGIIQLALTVVGVVYGPAPLFIMTFCWIVTDFVRILKGVLEPNDGEYR